tara:strand:+ start:18 stop:635 length:618 start_codon:yes stop_codon:yes gene_type:complete
MSIVKLNNNGVKNVTSFGSASSGALTFIKKLTADGTADNLSFVDGSSDVVLDNTYKEYLFTFKNIHPATDNASFSVNFSTDSGSNYNVTKTTSYFRSIHWENDTTAFGYDTGGDLAQSTDFQNIITVIGADNDQSGVGCMHLFNPSDTTFVKHFVVNAQKAHYSDISVNEFYAGYANTTSAIDAVQFKMSSGNIDSGTIIMYGVK